MPYAHDNLTTYDIRMQQLAACYRSTTFGTAASRCSGCDGAVLDPNGLYGKGFVTTLSELGAECFKILCLGGVAHERHHVVTGVAELSSEVNANEAGAAGDEVASGRL